GANQATIQRDGTLGGLKFVAGNAFQTLTCIGVTDTGAVLGRAIASSTGLTQQIFANGDNVLSVTCTWGNATGSSGDSAELIIHRDDNGLAAPFWIGSIITSTNQ
ncbi:MAG TPA: hypothetical protein VEV82_00605, partial [Actinomycetota bacterium]|nr:hypothetical protein [Actinomycetota bacterium]